jgi:hypothetical protein
MLGYKNFNRFRDFFIEENSIRWAELHEYKMFPFPVYTASVIPCICGVGYNSAGKIFDYFKGYSDPKAIDETQARMFKYGHDNEPKALAKFYELNPNFTGIKPGVIYHPERKNIGASLDQIILDPETNELMNLEIKCPYTLSIPLQTVEIKPNYLVQTTVQMACSGIKETLLFFWTPESSRTYHIPYSPELFKEIQKYVYAFDFDLKKGERWNRNKKPPNFINELEKAKNLIKPFQGEISNFLTGEENENQTLNEVENNYGSRESKPEPNNNNNSFNRKRFRGTFN